MLNHPLTKLPTQTLKNGAKFSPSNSPKKFQKMVQKIVQRSKGQMVQSIFYPMPSSIIADMRRSSTHAHYLLTRGYFDFLPCYVTLNSIEQNTNILLVP